MAVFMVTGTLILFGFDKAFSIVLGAIAAATAPAATIMVIKQYKAKGSLTETLLSVVALDDAVALIAFGVAVAISQMINNPSGANLLSQIASPVIEILMSLVIGGILGFLLVLPVRFYKDDASRQSLIYIFIFIALYIASKGGYSDLLTIMAMNYSGLIIAVITFLVIGLFHPIVIKGEYYFGTKCWWFFALCGVGFIVASLLVEHSILSPVLGVVGCSCLWSILELFEQRERVKKGWFPMNPKRKEEYKD